MCSAELVACDDRHRHLGDEADGLEVDERVVGEIGVERRRGRHADVVHRAPCSHPARRCDLARGHRAAGAFDVRDGDLLAELRAHRLGDQPGHRVGWAARGEWHDERDGAIGIAPRSPVSAVSAAFGRVRAGARSVRTCADHESERGEQREGLDSSVCHEADLPIPQSARDRGSLPPDSGAEPTRASATTTSSHRVRGRNARLQRTVVCTPNNEPCTHSCAPRTGRVIG